MLLGGRHGAGWTLQQCAGPACRSLLRRRGQVDGVETGREMEQIMLTVDGEALPVVGELANRLRELGFAVAEQTFLRTEGEEARRAVLLLTLHRPLDDGVDLITTLVSRAPADAWSTLALTLQALGSGRHTPAVLQLKTEDAFVSLVPRNLTDLEQAVRLLAPVAASIRRAVAGVPPRATEHRLVYSGGSWTIYGLQSHGTLVYDAAAGRLQSTSASGSA